MKKFRVILFSIAIAVGVGSAYAATTRSSCDYYQQYRYLNGMYIPVGEIGVQYACLNIGGWCTYYKPTLFSPYAPCRTGLFIPLY